MKDKHLLPIMIALILLMALIACVCRGAEPIPRPPEPNDVPFPWDANIIEDCNALRWYIVEPGVVLDVNIPVLNRTGRDVELMASYPGVTLERVAKDYEGEYWVQVFKFLWSPFQEGLHYVRISASDTMNQTDCRTLLIYVYVDDPPVIYPPDQPIITMADKQKVFQWTKKFDLKLNPNWLEVLIFLPALV